MGKKVILTYGTFDLFHIGHLKLIQRLAQLGDRLIVGVSTDEFNKKKNKVTVIPFEQRVAIVQNIKGVDAVISENSWNQKEKDILKYDVSVFAMGDDWEGKFDNLNTLCTVIYLPRTENISSTKLKKCLKDMEEKKRVESLRVTSEFDYALA